MQINQLSDDAKMAIRSVVANFQKIAIGTPVLKNLLTPVITKDGVAHFEPKTLNLDTNNEMLTTKKCFAASTVIIEKNQVIFRSEFRPQSQDDRPEFETCLGQALELTYKLTSQRHDYGSVHTVKDFIVHRKAADAFYWYSIQWCFYPNMFVNPANINSVLAGLMNGVSWMTPESTETSV